MDELGFRAQYPVLKSLLFGQFSLVIALPVVLRGVVADGEARPLGVVVLDISFNGLFEVGDSPVPVYSSLIQPFRASLTGLSVGFPALDMERMMFVSLMRSL